MKYTGMIEKVNLLAFIVLMLVFTACNDGDNETPVIKFSTSQSTANEDAGTVQIEITANKPVSTDVTLNFEVSGTAYINGDFKLKPVSPVTLKAGTKTAIVSIELIDDVIIESDDDLVIQLTSLSNNASLSKTTSELEYTLTIEDNDVVDDKKLQIDLTWTLGDGEDIDQVNLDLYLATNVVIEDNMVTDLDIFSRSEKTSGFESLMLDEGDKDTDYYIVIRYTKGNTDVEFTANVNGFGYVDEKITGTLKSTDVSGALFYGPLKKSGNTIGSGRKASGFHGLFQSSF